MKPVKQEVNGTLILPPLVFNGQTLRPILLQCRWRMMKVLYDRQGDHDDEVRDEEIENCDVVSCRSMVTIQL